MSERSSRQARRDGRVSKQWQKDLCQGPEDPRLASVEPELLRVTCSALTDFLHAQNAPPVNLLSRTVTLAASLEVSVHGQLREAPIPRCNRTSFSTFDSCRSRFERRLGVVPDRGSLKRRAEKSPTGALPVSELTFFFAPEVIVAAATLIADGPDVAAARVTRALAALSDEWVRPNRRAAAHKRGEGGAVSNYATATWTWFAAVTDARGQRLFDSPELDAWQATPDQPDLDDPDVLEGAWEVLTVPLPILRLALRVHIEKAGGRLGSDDPRMWPALARGASAHKLKGTPQLLRNLAILATLGVLGCRAGAVASLRVGDFVPAYAHPELGCTPALRIRAQKQKKRNLRRYKPLPPILAAIVETWLIVYSHYLGRPLDSTDPLIPSKAGGGAVLKPIDRSSVTSLCSGQGNLRTRSGSPARLPLDIEAIPYWAALSWGRMKLGRQFPEGFPESSYDGYSPHAVRHLVSETVCGPLGKRWLTDNGMEWRSVDDVSDALLDHKMGSDPHGYKGRKAEIGRSALSSIGARIMEAALLSDFGAGKVLDLDAIAECDDVLRGLDMRRQMVERERDALLTELESSGAARGRDRMLERKADKLRDSYEEWRARREELVDDPRHHLPVDDVVAFREHVPPLITASDAAPDLPEREILRTAGRVRDWLLLHEAADLWGFPVSSLRKLCLGDYAGRSRRLPFAPGDASCFQQLDKKTRIIFIDRTDPALIDTPEREEKLELLLSRFPKGFENPNGKRSQIKKPDASENPSLARLPVARGDEERGSGSLAA